MLPPFALFINAGYGIAPLAHAVVISPGVDMLVANLLSMVVDRRPMPANRMAIDLKSAKGVALVLDLVRDSELMIEDFARA